MKRIFCFLLTISMIIAAAIPALAAEADTPTTTPLTTDVAIVKDTAESVYPVNIIISDDKTEIRKVYECPVGNTTCEIPRDAFELNGYSYQFFDMLKQDEGTTDRKEITETVTFDSKKNDMDTVMSLLPQTKDMTYEDGFSGTLVLITSSIKTEVSGYGSSSKTVTTTRTYPNLSDCDMQYIPKTTEHDGKTLEFESVEWKIDNTMNVDDYEIGDRYTAIVTYSSKTSYSYVKGYTVTAQYKGEVSKSYIGMARYTVIFMGTPIPTSTVTPTEKPIETPTETPTSTPNKDSDAKAFNWLILIIPLALAALVGGGVFVQKNLKDRKEKNNNEKDITTDDGDTDADDEHDDYPGISG